MCICCVAVPVVAATGLSLDKKQRKSAEAKETTAKRTHPFLVLTVITIFLLNAGSVIIHTRFYQFGL
jgi:hypothetical protein